MKFILLTERDQSIFGQPLLPVHHTYVIRNHNDIINMVNDQSTGFWLRFITTFRSVLYKMGFIPRKDRRAIFAEETFIEMLNMMIDHDKNRREFKLKQLMVDIRMFYRYNYLLHEAALPVHLIMTCPGIRPSLERLFGKAHEAPKKMVKFVQWTRFMASLIGCAEHWKVAQPVSSLNEMPWRAPVQWYHHSKIHRANLFEGYLKQKWGDKLIQTVNFEFPNIAWWNDVEEITVTRTSRLATKFPQVVHFGKTMEFDPITSGDEEETYVNTEETELQVSGPTVNCDKEGICPRKEETLSRENDLIANITEAQICLRTEETIPKISDVITRSDGLHPETEVTQFHSQLFHIDGRPVCLQKHTDYAHKESHFQPTPVEKGRTQIQTSLEQVSTLMQQLERDRGCMQIRDRTPAPTPHNEKDETCVLVPGIHVANQTHEHQNDRVKIYTQLPRNNLKQVHILTHQNKGSRAHVHTPSYSSKQAHSLTRHVGEGKVRVHTRRYNSNQVHSVTQRLGEGKNHVNTPSYDSSQAPLITQQMGESRNHVHTLSHDSNQTHSMKRQMEEATLHVGAPSYDSNQAHLMTHQMEEDRLHFQIPTRNAPNQADNQTLYPEGGEFHSWKAPHISITPQTGSTVHFWPSQEYFISQVYTPTSQFGRSADSVSTQPVHFHNQFYAPPTQTSHTPWTPTAYALNQAHQARAMSDGQVYYPQNPGVLETSKSC